MKKRKDSWVNVEIVDEKSDLEKWGELKQRDKEVRDKKDFKHRDVEKKRLWEKEEDGSLENLFGIFGENFIPFFAKLTAFIWLR